MNSPPEQFEWDEAKRRTNLRKHGVDFKRATLVFDDPLVKIQEDEFSLYFDEEREQAIGMVSGTVMIVVYTYRGEKIRIISARKAEPNERRLYEEED